MRLLLAIACVCLLGATSAMADGPLISYGPEGDSQTVYRPDACQYGFTDGGIGWGYTLGYGQSLGIHCPAAGCIGSVGGYFEGVFTPGQIDIIIYDNGVEVFRQAVSPVAGVNDWDITDTAIGGDACIMFCPIGNFHGITGEDFSNPPFGHTYWSTDCTCQNEFTDIDLTIWAELCGAVPTEEISWGQVKSLYR